MSIPSFNKSKALNTKPKKKTSSTLKVKQIQQNSKSKKELSSNELN